MYVYDCYPTTNIDCLQSKMDCLQSICSPSSKPNTCAAHKPNIPLIAAVARRVLTQPVCASAAERNWSVYGRNKNDTTIRMGHAVADKRVYCHEALHLKQKLQSATSRPWRSGTRTPTRTSPTTRPTWPCRPRPRAPRALGCCCARLSRVHVVCTRIR